MDKNLSFEHAVIYGICKSWVDGKEVIYFQQSITSLTHPGHNTSARPMKTATQHCLYSFLTDMISFHKKTKVRMRLPNAATNSYIVHHCIADHYDHYFAIASCGIWSQSGGCAFVTGCSRRLIYLIIKAVYHHNFKALTIHKLVM